MKVTILCRMEYKRNREGLFSHKDGDSLSILYSRIVVDDQIVKKGIRVLSLLGDSSSLNVKDRYLYVEDFEHVTITVWFLVS